MKGTVFQRPLEFNLHVEGESWAQGDLIAGTLIVKNHGNDPVALDDVRVQLALGKLSKVRQKTADAFKVQATVAMEAGTTVAPGAETRLEWKFQTDRNCPITDNLSSLFLIYGLGDATPQLGQLELPVQAYQLIQEYLKTLNIQFRFVLKGQKASHGRVEAKFAPPASQTFALLDHVLVYFRFEGEALEVSYVFIVKKIEANVSSIDVTKKKKEFTQCLAPDQYRLSSGRVNHEGLELSIKEALGHVESKMFQ